MVRAYYMQDPVTNQRDSCELDPPREATEEDLKRCDVWTMKIPIENDWEQKLDEEAKKVGLNYRDEIHVNKDKMPNYEKKIKIFFEEHLHVDPEVRFVKGGSGYFDVRDREDKWIRLAVSAGDFIFLPAGIYHRFTVDNNDYINAIRLFKDEPIWEAFNRSDHQTDEKPIRAEYLNTIQ
ncbi:unnamed protein product, partial [Mesorhabditis spiculigera]